MKLYYRIEEEEDGKNKTNLIKFDPSIYVFAMFVWMIGLVIHMLKWFYYFISESLSFSDDDWIMPFLYFAVDYFKWDW